MYMIINNHISVNRIEVAATHVVAFRIFTGWCSQQVASATLGAMSDEHTARVGVLRDTLQVLRKSMRDASTALEYQQSRVRKVEENITSYQEQATEHVRVSAVAQVELLVCATGIAELNEGLDGAKSRLEERIGSHIIVRAAVRANLLHCLIVIIAKIPGARNVRTVNSVISFIAQARAIKTLPVVRAVSGADIAKPHPHIANHSRKQ